MYASATLLVYAGVVVALAYLVRGVAGFGSGLVAVSLLAIALPLSLVVPLVAALDLAASAVHATRGRRQVRWRELARLLPAALGGLVIALILHRMLAPESLVRALGVFLIGYAVYALRPPAAAPRSRWWATPLGAAGGLVDALFGTGGPFYVVYLRVRCLAKHEFRATIALILLVLGAARLSGYLFLGMVTPEALVWILGALPVMALALYIGEHLHVAVSQRNFERFVAVTVGASGAVLLIK